MRNAVSMARTSSRTTSQRRCGGTSHDVDATRPENDVKVTCHDSFCAGVQAKEHFHRLATASAKVQCRLLPHIVTDPLVAPLCVDGALRPVIADADPVFPAAELETDAGTTQARQQVQHSPWHHRDVRTICVRICELCIYFEMARVALSWCRVQSIEANRVLLGNHQEPYKRWVRPYPAPVVIHAAT